MTLRTLTISALATVALVSGAFAGNLGQTEVAPMVEAPEEVAGSSNGSSVNPLWIILPLALGAVLLADDDTVVEEEIEPCS